MPRIAWLTDIHLDFLESPQDVLDFLLTVREAAADVVLVGGDVASAPSLTGYLEQMAEVIDRPIHLVLGNHDFYYSSIREVRDSVAALCRRQSSLNYLSTSGPVALSPTLGLVGHDGWADGRTGDYEQSTVMLNDYQLIAELAPLSKSDLLDLLHALGDEAARHIREVLPASMEQFDNTLLLTHVPPLREACWHNGETSDDEWAPHFTCIAVGNAILEVARQFPGRNLAVLCGHTHSHGRCRPLPNVAIHTAAAIYGQPAIAARIDLK